MAKTRLNSNQFTLKFNDVAATNWVTDNTYEDYGYRCDLACKGVTSDMYANVIFDVDTATSGYYSSFCQTDTDIVSIFSSITDGITVSSIIVM